ncbi:MAG TPA: single-stranded-DNA-specific exonuclease RecJ [Anaerolineae bacterium]|nr:single-stranded-DNA-specific exonuclease RecJ [Anaerolineae bacterium]
MAVLSKRWALKPPLDAQQHAAWAGAPLLLAQLLANRKIAPESAQHFLEGRGLGYDPLGPEPLLGVQPAVERLVRAVQVGERIAVFGDFDADGVAATVLLVQTLHGLGAEVEPYIPHRVDEGYGLNIDALRALYKKGVRVVVTVDCGIRSVHEVAKAEPYLSLIITDHHEPGHQLPPATAVINPKQPGCPYPFKGLAGVGVAFKLAQALFRAIQPRDNHLGLSEESLLDLVALGTVADLAPLLGENRVLVCRGLEALKAPARPGIEALMANAGVRRGQVDAAAIGFRLGPRLNAAGRLESAMAAYDLLAARDPEHAKALAAQLGDLNRRRQELTEETFDAAEALVQAGDPGAPLLFVAGSAFQPGIVGLAASRLADAHYRPAVVVEVGEGESRGSCRSIPEFHITEALDRCGDLLTRHGGHAAAAGFTVANQKLEELRWRLVEIAGERLAGLDLRPELQIDAEVPLEEVDWATLTLLQQLEPCGMDNPQPVLVSRGVTVADVRAIGGEGKHLRLTLRDGRRISWDALFWRQGERAGEIPGCIDVAYTLEAHEWNGTRRLQLNVQDLRSAEH